MNERIKSDFIERISCVCRSHESYYKIIYSFGMKRSVEDWLMRKVYNHTRVVSSCAAFSVATSSFRKDRDDVSRVVGILTASDSSCSQIL